MFQPEVSVKGLTWNSVSIGWSQPGEDRIREHVDLANPVVRANSDTPDESSRPAKTRNTLNVRSIVWIPIV